ncbi:MAG: ABC transporter ATP-binding protein [Deltaproteobacteria bacterium]|nr:ABC transporter ATP-binding protein [Deltaproteobacteria bacterium]
MDGLSPEQPYFYDYLTPREILELAAALFDLAPGAAHRQVADAIERLGLGHVRDTPLRKLSKGWVQRVGLAQALVGEPELVILDEPMSGLDPVGRREVRGLISSLKHRGTSVLFSSHILSDAELLCDRVAVIVEGRIRYEGQLSKLGSSRPSSIELVVEAPDPELIRVSAGEPVELDLRDGKVWVRVGRQEAVDRVIAGVLAHRGRVLSVTPNGIGLEEIFSQAVRSKEGGAE